MEDLQSLLEKINRDGVEKAEAEAKRIVSEAEAKAAAMLDEARAEAGRLRAQAEKDAAGYAAHAAETVRQGARDVVLGVEASVRSLLEKLLAKNVEKALADEATAAALAAEAVKELAGPGEISCGPRLAAALRAQLAALGGFTVTVDEAAGAGFSVKTDGGRVESSFTADAIAAELARRLRPDLAKLMK